VLGSAAVSVDSVITAVWELVVAIVSRLTTLKLPLIFTICLASAFTKIALPLERCALYS
jgi:hypothetical protein